MADPYRPVAASLVRAGALVAAALLAALLTIGRSEAAFAPAGGDTVDTAPAGATPAGAIRGPG